MIRLFTITLFFCFIDLLSLKAACPGVPTITSFTPASGPVGTLVTINGSNFDPMASNNVVYFGATMATVTAVSATSLTVRVPYGSTYTPISVSNVNACGLTAYSSSPFIVTYSCATVFSASSLAAKVDFASTTTYGYFDMAVGDLDGDGKPDIALSGGKQLSLYHNTSSSNVINSGSFSGVDVKQGGSSMGGLVIADVDGDGKLDIIAAGIRDTIWVFHNISSSGTLDASSFGPRVAFLILNSPNPINTAPQNIKINDLDGDGKPDIIVMFGVHGNNWTELAIFPNTSSQGTINSASFGPPIFITMNNYYAEDLKIADMDGDGKPDIVEGILYNNNVVDPQLFIYQNNCTPGNITAAGFSLSQFNINNGGFGVLSLGLADIDGDGKTDAFVQCQSTPSTGGHFSYCQNTSSPGNMSLGTPVNQTDYYFIGGTGIGDINGDGKADVCITSDLGNSSLVSQASVYLNQYGGSFSNTYLTGSNIDFATDFMPLSPVIVDLDGDGKPDLLVPSVPGYSNHDNNMTFSIYKNMSCYTPCNLTSVSLTSSKPTICIGDSTTLSATAIGSTAVSYIWSPGGQTTSSLRLNPTVTTNYSVFVTDTVEGCSKSGTITIVVDSIPVLTTSASQEICSGLSLPLTASGAGSYTWSPITGLNRNTGSAVTASPTATTTYTVTGANGKCMSTAMTTITIDPSPVANAGQQASIVPGSSTPLSGSGGGTYSWSPATGLSCLTCSNPIASPGSTTTYTLTVSNGNCSSTDTVTVNVELICGDLFVPNAFSPNGDGQNDQLFVRDNCIIKMNFYIYDRWGQKVFESSNPSSGWNGNYNGKKLDPAVFIYYLHVTLINGNEVERKGNISLIR